jgi:hypothetical protein
MNGSSITVLTDRKRRFAEHYIETGGRNGAEAARLAGYSDHAGADKVAASRLLRDDDVLAELRRLAQCRISAAVAVAAAELEDIASDRHGSKDRGTQLKAVQAILDRGGLLVERLSRLDVNVHHSIDTLPEGDKWRRDLPPLFARMGIRDIDMARFHEFCDWLNGPAQPALIDVTPTRDDEPN